MQDHGSLDHNVVAPVRVLSGRFGQTLKVQPP